MAATLYFLCSVFVVIATVESTCPDGWVVFDGSCYMFSHQKHSFLDAERACAHYGAHLVNINNAAENGFLKSYCGDLKDGNRWIGLTDEAIENLWIWYDNSERAVFTDWARGEPQGAKAENCVVLYISSSINYQWADIPCNSVFGYVCEKQADNLIVS